MQDAIAARDERRAGAVAKMSALKGLRADMRGMVRELGERDETIGRLQVDLSRAKGAPRSAYTERTLDVVRSLRKQKAAIEAILGDIRGSQQEVNRLSETLQRSFAARSRGEAGRVTSPRLGSPPLGRGARGGMIGGWEVDARK